MNSNRTWNVHIPEYRWTFFNSDFNMSENVSPSFFSDQPLLLCKLHLLAVIITFSFLCQIFFLPPRHFLDSEADGSSFYQGLPAEMKSIKNEDLISYCFLQKKRRKKLGGFLQRFKCKISEIFGEEFNSSWWNICTLTSDFFSRKWYFSSLTDDTFPMASSIFSFQVEIILLLSKAKARAL